MKKIIAVLLTIIMTFSIISMPVSAALDTDQVKTDVENVVEDVTNIFDSVIDIIDAVHQLVGGILSIFDKECPFCGVVHGDEDATDVCYITYNYNRKGIANKKQKVVIGEVPVEPEIKEVNGYVFLGWYTDKALTIPYYFESPIYESFNLYAKWAATSIDDIEFLNQGTVEQEQNNASVNGVSVDYELESGTGSVVINNAVGIINNVFAKIGNAVDISVVGNDKVKTATITFNFNEDELPEGTTADDLGILWYDEANNKMVLLENVVIDKEKGTISVVTSHFSKYVVVNSTKWVEQWAHKQLVSRVNGTTVRFNIVLCLDDSGSMYGTAKNVCQQAARNFIDQLVTGDNIAVIKFNSNATTLVSPTAITDSNKETIKQKIVLSASGGTSFNNSLDSAISLLNSMPKKTLNNEILKNYILFLSDGQSSVGDTQIAELVKWGYNVIAIGVGNSVSASELQKLATESGGSYAHVSDPSQIDSVFEQVQGEYIGLSLDSDGDGIADLVEKTGMIANDGNIYTTDPYNADTDGDGRSDGEEMGVYNDVNGCFEINSSPTTPTADGVGFDVDFSVLPHSTKQTDLESYQRVRIKATINVYGGHAFPKNDLGMTDYLSDIDYQDLENVRVEVFKNGKILATGSEKSLSEGSSTEINTINDNDVALQDNTYVIQVSSTNGGTVRKEIKYNPKNTWSRIVWEQYDKAEKQMLEKGTNAVRAYSNIVKEKEDAVVDAIMINCLDVSIGNNQHYKIAQNIATELQKVLANRMVEEAKYWSQKSGWAASYDAEDVVKAIGKRCEAGTDEFDVTVGKYEYDVQINDIGKWQSVGFGTIKAINKTTNEEFNFTWASSPKEVESSINSFMDECKVLYDKSLDDVINKTFSDAKSILSVDQLKTFVTSKVGEHFDALMSLYGGKIGFKFNDLKNCYDYYKKAEKAINSIQGDLTNTNKLKSALTNVNSFLTAAGQL